MFVEYGATMFTFCDAKKQHQQLFLIDEIDAAGRQRVGLVEVMTTATNPEPTLIVDAFLKEMKDYCHWWQRNRSDVFASVPFLRPGRF